MKRALRVAALALLAGCGADGGGGSGSAPPASPGPTSPYAAWPNGPPADPTYFPIGVWLQSPSRADAYKALGINLLVGLWQGPTESQLSGLTQRSMPVLCSQNAVGLAHLTDPIIQGWTQQDEPDNAQPLPEGGYGPPVAPSEVQAIYASMKAADPSRPVFLNLGQGVAYDGWIGRGVRTNHPEDYPEYAKGCDIVSFDIYPVTSNRAEVKGNLWYVALGVQRLVQWTGGAKPVWNAIECTHINSTEMPTPDQVRAEVWMSLIHGSRGIMYFVHEWVPTFREDGIFRYPEMVQAVTAINGRIRDLAPALNCPGVTEGVTVATSDTDVPIAAMVKRFGGETYVFAVAMRDGPVLGTFTLSWLGDGVAEVLDEGRQVAVAGGRFSDAFGGYGVHLYRIR